MSNRKRIIQTVSGQICSGKTTFINNEAQDFHCVIDVGNIVRNINNDEKRLFDHSLDTKIILELYKAIDDKDQDSPIVIVGIRQLSILKALQDRYKIHHNIVLYCPDEIREHRFNARKDKKDQTITFKQAELGDKQLGIIQLLSYLYNDKKTIVINNFDNSEIVKYINSL